MHLSSLQQQLFSKCQRRSSQATSKQNTPSTKSGRTFSLASALHRVRGLVLTKKSTHQQLHSLSPPRATSPVVYQKQCRKSFYSSDFSLPSYCESSKSDALESLIFDHPSVTVRISPAAYVSC
ncbi:hypothetical protein BDF14DRAFT_1886538 [Spinellus fusiger]|nr:hypothetical protein BDF14DRAFT_1886538 [Spinellus fusiger]